MQMNSDLKNKSEKVWGNSLYDIDLDDIAINSSEFSDESRNIGNKDMNKRARGENTNDTYSSVVSCVANAVSQWTMTGSHHRTDNSNIRLMEIRVRYTNLFGHWGPWESYLDRSDNGPERRTKNRHVTDTYGTAGMLLDERISRALNGPYQRPMTSGLAMTYKTARSDFTINRESNEKRSTSRKISDKKSKSFVEMERLSIEELKARRDRAMDKLKRYTGTPT